MALVQFLFTEGGFKALVYLVCFFVFWSVIEFFISRD